MYKQMFDKLANKISNSVIKDDIFVIPFGLANTDYQRFKQEINADETQLQDVDGNVMSADAAKEFVAGLP